MIDDASNTLFARFVREDSTAEHMKVLWQYLERYGRPQAFYTDKAGLFRVNPKRLGYGEELSREGETQIGRALRELGIELIHAHSPQAKGRVERCFGTLQDRLVKGLRKAGVGTLETANQYLEQTFLPQWNKRFCCEPANVVDAHRELGDRPQLASALSHVERRRVTNDYTISWQAQHFQIQRDSVHPGLKSAKVRVEERLDGSLWARVEDRTIELKACQRKATEVAPPPSIAGRKDHNRGGRSKWMKNFDLSKSWPIGQATQKSNQSG